MGPPEVEYDLRGLFFQQAKSHSQCAVHVSFLHGHLSLSSATGDEGTFDVLRLLEMVLQGRSRLF